MCLFTFLPPLELPVNDLFGSFLQSTPGLPIEESHKSENPQFFSKFPSTLERRPSVSFEDFTVIQTHTNHFSFRWVILRGSGVMTVLLLFWWHSFYSVISLKIRNLGNLSTLTDFQLFRDYLFWVHGRK